MAPSSTRSNTNTKIQMEARELGGRTGMCVHECVRCGIVCLEHTCITECV